MKLFLSRTCVFHPIRVDILCLPRIVDRSIFARLIRLIHHRSISCGIHMYLHFLPFFRGPFYLMYPDVSWSKGNHQKWSLPNPWTKTSLTRYWKSIEIPNTFMVNLVKWDHSRQKNNPMLSRRYRRFTLIMSLMFLRPIWMRVKQS